MAKLDKKINECRMSGARWILEYAKEHGIDEAENELKKRGARFIPLEIPRNLWDEMEQGIANQTAKTFFVIWCAMFKDKRHYGKQRLTDLMNDFNEFAEAFFDCQSDGTHYVTIADYEKEFVDNYGFNFDMDVDVKSVLKTE